jgi:hypothetical protein
MTSIFPSAAAGQTVKQNDNEYEVVKEGLAVILKPATKDMSSNPHKKEAECESQQDSAHVLQSLIDRVLPERYKP